ncbi:MAG: SDR family oxidoreductase [Planctomycetota bacterium]
MTPPASIPPLDRTGSEAGVVSLRAVITGASSGIGRQIAMTLGSRFPGSKAEPSRFLVHFRRNESGAREVVESLRELGCQASSIAADLTQPADRTRLIEAAWSAVGTPTTWVNNAGADVLTGQAAEWSFETKLQTLLETDVIGTIALSRDVATRLREDQRAGSTAEPPSMTFIGWDQAPLGMEGEAGQMFGPVKAAVMAFANSFAQEHSPHLRVNTVAPGWIKTAWGEETKGYWDRRAKQQSLMNRWGRPSDVASAVAFAADPNNTFCTGQTLNVNGGWNRTVPRSPQE